jgi:hypothetical protein
MALKDTIRFRTTRTFKTRFNRVARAEKKRASDLGRDLIADYVEKRESELAQLPGLERKSA